MPGCRPRLPPTRKCASALCRSTATGSCAGLRPWRQSRRCHACRRSCRPEAGAGFRRPPELPHPRRPRSFRAVRWLRGLLLLSIGPLPLCAQSGEAIQQRLHDLLARGDYQTELPDVAADRNSGERSNLAGNGAARRHRHGEVGGPIAHAPGQSLRLPGFGGAGEALLWTLVVVLDVLLVVAIARAIAEPRRRTRA